MKEIKHKNLDTVERATLYLTWSLPYGTHKHKTLQKEKKLATRKQLISENGITLIALAVTILIMLILAGVTISVALSDGGLIDTTKEAVDRQRIAEMKTKIELIVTNWTVQKMLNENVTVDDLKQALVDEGVTDSKDKITGSDGKYEVETKDGDIFEITIDESGNIKVNLKGEEGPGGEDKPGGDQTEASLEISVTGATVNSVNVSVTTNSLEGNTLTYSYKDISGAEYTVVKQNSNETSHNFIGLASNTAYNIKVELKSAEGKVLAEKVIETRTEEQKIGTISQKGELTWNNGKASLELQSTEPTDVIQYQIGSNTGTWNDYTGAIGNLNSGDTVYVKVKGSSVETTIPIIDGIAPTVTVQRGTVNTSSITAVVTARDDQSGMPTNPTYQYYIKKTSETAYPQNPSYIGSNMSNAFTGLIQGTNYDIKVTVNDIAGNEGTGFLNNISTENVGGATGGLTTGNITLGTVTWSNGLATVTLNTSTSLSIQYQKNSNTEGNWTTAGFAATITDLQHGDTVFARLWDGTNAGSDASVSIIDDKEPQVATISFSPETAKVGETIIATVTLTDNESGINLANSRWIYNNSSTPLGTEEASLYTGGNFTTNPQILNLTAENEGTYYLHVLSVDNGENKKETVSRGIEIASNLPEGWDKEKVTAEKSKDDVVVPVPIGFTPSTIEGENTVENGFVIKQGANGSVTEGINEFVWVPVPNPEEMFTTNLDGKPAGQLYDFTANDDPTKVATPRAYPTTKNMDYREPDVVTGADLGADSTSGTNSDAKDTHLNILGLSSAEEFKTQLEQEFLKMKTSIETYKGFYIGRYETGNLSTTKAVVQKGNEDIHNQNWYIQYVKSKTIVEGTNVTSSMIWGCQWDACLRWFLTSKDATVVSYVTYSKTKGHYSGTYVKPIVPTGSDRAFKVNNIYDMAGNVFDWTIEADNNYNRVKRRRQLHLCCT